MRKKVELNQKGALPTTVGALMESTIHSAATEIADGIYGMGYVARDQRIKLSGAISDALAAFTKTAGDISNITVESCDADTLMGDDEDAVDMTDTSPDEMGDGTMMGMMSEKAEMYGGVARDKLKNSDFVFPMERAFPVMTAKDVHDAVSSWGRYKGKESFDSFKSKLIALCKRKGLMSALPKEWDAKKADDDPVALLTAWLTSHLVAGSKSLYDQNQSEYIWNGVSHNAWQDTKNDIIPLALIEEDIAIQKALIKSGKIDQFGHGLWLDHEPTVLGDCKLRELVPNDGRSCFEMGNLKPEWASLGAKSMSIGYWYGLNSGGEYEWVTVYERSALKATRPVNARTLFSIKRREIVRDAALQKSIDEIAAAIMEN